jgi:hypothetical protein
MSDAWDRLITEMIRQMIREFISRPAELLTFGLLAHRTGSDRDVLHAIAEQRRDLFLITADDRFVKLFPEAVQRIIETGVERTIAEIRPSTSNAQFPREYSACEHFSSDAEIVRDLVQCSFSPESLTRSCCWKQICRVRADNYEAIDGETWKEICRIRGYLLARQNPRGF